MSGEIDRASLTGGAAIAGAPTNALTCDVEEYFQVAAFERTLNRSSWDLSESRVETSTNCVLDLFGMRAVKATFFVLGWIAERHRSLIQRIVNEGHELASHGYDHTRVHTMTPAQFRADVVRTKSLLEDIGGTLVRGYRAPSYSIDARNLWALDVLGETGHGYSSSVYPIKHDLYGMPEAPRWPFRVGTAQILEVPVTTVRLWGRNYPCGGGGYFRLMPYPVFRRMLNRVNQHDRQPGLFYFHPWELDAAQPRVRNAPVRSRVRHYLNLSSMPGRLERLLTDFKWGRMDKVFLNSAESPAAAGGGGLTPRLSLSPDAAGDVRGEASCLSPSPAAAGEGRGEGLR
jgi:polysaccharide deacetylase family protein (PEP-CTERM system associated)